MARVTGMFRVSGIRCERCVLRLANALEDQPGLAAAHANLMGEVTLTWDDDLTTRETLTRALSASGFHERVPV
jgi:copper chaperone CopZ